MVCALRSFRLACLALVITAVGCASPPPKPTIVKATIESGSAVNPDARGRASPVVVRVYELKTLAAFSQADFFTLYERDKETLGADLLSREEYQLMPGESKQLTRTIQAEGKHIGVMAAFRDLEHAQWRANVMIPPAKTSSFVIKLEGNKVTISGS